MSKYQARAALDQLVGRPAFVSPAHAGQGIGFDAEVTSGAMLADLRALAEASPAEEKAATADRMALLASMYGFGETASDKPFVYSNGRALIPIHGILINRFSWSWGFVTGYNFIRNQLAAAMADDDVSTIVFDVNSYGGTVAGCQETADMLFSARADEGGKTSIAVVDANCHSAAYYLASQCDHIAVTSTGSVGSVGVVMMHADVSKLLDDIGVKITFIHAGAHKVDGNMYEPLSDDVKAELQAEIDAMYDTFVSYVANGRGLDEEDIRNTEARSYGSADALELGLVDAVQNPSGAVEAYFDALDAQPEAEDTSDEQENAVLVKTAAVKGQTAPAATAEAAEVTSAAEIQAAATAAAAEARTAERARVKGIQGHAEATGREALAAHLAMNTDLDVETAGGILAASPKSAPVAAAEAAEEETNHFQKAMDKGRQPNVGASAESEGESGDDTVSPAKRILALQARHMGTSAAKH